MDKMLTGQENAISTFEKRKNYASTVSLFFDTFDVNEEAYTIDTLGERNLYGRVDHMNRPITPKPNKIISVTQDKKELFGFDFVLDAWMDFTAHYLPLAKRHLVAVDLSNISLLSKHLFLQEFQTFSIPEVASINSKILSIASARSISKLRYKELFLTFLYEQHKSWPASFLLSSNFPPTATCLVVEVGKFNFLDDSQKIKKFWNKNNFTLFLESAKRFGFLVDSFAPWRLFFNLNSVAASYYIQRRREFSEIQSRIFAGEENSTHSLTNFLERFGPLGEARVRTVHLDHIFREYFDLLETQNSWAEDLISLGFSLLLS